MSDQLRVTVFDYGAGNLHSLLKALDTPGSQVRVETDPVLAVRDTDALVLPGVGAFSPAADCLAPGLSAMRAALEEGLPCLGICLGMQLLFDGSDEGPGLGLGLFAGRVTRLTADRVPQIALNVGATRPSTPCFARRDSTWRITRTALSVDRLAPPSPTSSRGASTTAIGFRPRCGAVRWLAFNFTQKSRRHRASASSMPFSMPLGAIAIA